MSTPRGLHGTLAAFAAVGCLGVTVSGHGTTYASFSDSTSVTVTAEAGIWAPDPPAACGPLSQYHGVVWGTQGDDDLHGGDRPQIIMGLDGNDTIHAGNRGDCVVGGPGDDRLIGRTAAGITTGGPGQDDVTEAPDDTPPGASRPPAPPNTPQTSSTPAKGSSSDGSAHPPATRPASGQTPPAKAAEEVEPAGRPGEATTPQHPPNQSPGPEIDLEIDREIGDRTTDHP